jgi:hypothetical protein
LDYWTIRTKKFDVDRAKGIHVCDRTPLDPISFNKKEERPAKAKRIRRGLSPGKSKREPHQGQVILLTGEARELETRVVGRHKNSPEAVIEGLQTSLLEILDDSENGLIKIDTSNLAELSRSMLK